MINLNYIKNQKFNNTLLVQILFYTFPLWFIIGNLAVSIHSLLFIITSLFLIKTKQLNLRFNKTCWILLIFFLYFFISTLIQFKIPGVLNERIQTLSLENNPIFKSFLLFRFLILIIVIDTLFFNKIIELKKLLLFSLICTSFVSIDVIFQYLIGYDIFGYKSFYTWNSGPFGDEKIASTYLKNFSFLSFFYIFVNSEYIKNKKMVSISIILIHLLGILLAGNRMPFILFLFGLFLIVLFIKNLRFNTIIGLIIFLPFFFIITKYDSNFSYAYKNFFSEINLVRILNKETKKIEETKEKVEEVKKEKFRIPKEITLLRHSGYNRVFRTSILMWLEQPLFGFGLKSFRIKCWEMLEKDNLERETSLRPQYIACANHPHNYYLEILSEGGVIGVVLLISFFIVILKNSIKNFIRYKKNNNLELYLITPFILVFFLEIWPLKSSGSFFTTWGATFFWFSVAILIALNKEDNPKI